MRPPSAALAVLCLLLVACSADPTEPTATPTTAPSPTLSMLTLEDLPTGRAPRIGYVDGADLRRPDGSRTALPGARRRGVGSVVVTATALLVSDAEYFEGSNGLQLITDDHGRVLGPCTSGSGAGDDERAAWVTFTCPESGQAAPTLLHVRTADGTETSFPVTVAPNTNVVSSVAGFLDGDVVVNRAFGMSSPVRYDQTGRARPMTAVTWVRSIDEVAGLVVADLPGRGGIQGVVDTRTDEVLWRSKRLLPAFSPDGTRVVVARTDGSATVVAARTGQPVVELAASPGIDLDEFTWEDDDHVLAVATSGSAQCIVRFDRGGRTTRVTPMRRLRPATSGPSGYLLPIQP